METNYVRNVMESTCQEPLGRRRVSTVAVIAAGALFAVLAGCASTTGPEPIAVSKIAPGPNEQVVDHALILLDTSGSVDETTQFPAERSLLRSFVGGMPDGSYEVGVITFGGADRDIFQAANFDRSSLGAYAAEIPYLSDGTPLHTVLRESRVALEGKVSNAAVIVVSDGLPSDAIGRDISTDLSLSAGRELADSYAGTLCIHTVQLGDDPAGRAFLAQLAQTTACGTTRTADSLTTEVAFQSFGRDALLTDLPQVAAPAPVGGDSDQDGVLDSADQCSGTPSGAKVDARGCWVIPGVHFAVDSDQIEPGSRQRFDQEVLPVLSKNPGLRVRIDGHTDASGGEGYNQGLSERRAESVRRELISQGVAADRVETQGFGEGRPAATNDTAEGRRINRRTEINALR